MAARIPGPIRTHKGKLSPLYRVWRAMRIRCEYAAHKSYHRYGGRGIRVCERWQHFEFFAEDMGDRPAGSSIERIDNDGDYQKSNCRWATRREQSLNKYNNRRIVFNGATRTISEWAELAGLSHQTIRARLMSDWPLADALTLPADPRRRSDRG